MNRQTGGGLRVHRRSGLDLFSSADDTTATRPASTHLWYPCRPRVWPLRRRRQKRMRRDAMYIVMGAPPAVHVAPTSPVLAQKVRSLLSAVGRRMGGWGNVVNVQGHQGRRATSTPCPRAVMTRGTVDQDGDEGGSRNHFTACMRLNKQNIHAILRFSVPVPLPTIDVAND